MEALRNTFARQAIPMTWDFADGNPFSDASGNWLNNIDWTAKVAEQFGRGIPALVRHGDAASNRWPDGILVSTDPPYYDNIGYADLSDFFYVWLRRTLRVVFRRSSVLFSYRRRESSLRRHIALKAADKKQRDVFPRWHEARP